MYSTEDVINHIGLGWWQLPSVLAPGIVHLGEAYQTVAASLLNSQVDFRCLSNQDLDHVPNVRENDSYYNNDCGAHGDTDLGNNSILGYVANDTRYCGVIQYDSSVFISTATTEFDLVCDDAHLRALFQAAFFIGGMVGSFTNGVLGDKYGRRTVLRYASVLYVLTCSTVSFMPNYPLVVLARFLTGIPCFMTYLSSYCLAIEIVPTKHRAAVGLLPGIFYGLAVALFAIEGYLLPQWRYLNLCAAAPNLLIIPLSLIIDESPRWLIQQGRNDEAEKIMIKAAKRNKSELPQYFNEIFNKSKKESSMSSKKEKSVKEEIQINKNGDLKGENKLELKEATKTVDKLNPTEENNYLKSCVSITSHIVTKSNSTVQGLLMLFKTPEMRKRTVAIFVVWILEGALYYGILLNASNFSRSNVFLYMAILGLCEIPGVLGGAPAASYFSRKIIIGSSLFLAGMFTLADFIIPTSLVILKWILVMLAFISVSIAYNMNYVYAPELFPTEIRARGSSLCTVMGNLGSFLAPVITDVLATYRWWLVGLTLGCCGIISGLVVMILPETKDRPMPDTVEEIESNKLLKK